MSHDNYDALTIREQEVLRLMVAGCSNREIADELVITVGTARWYTKQIYSKLEVHNRSQAIIRAIELGMGAGGLMLRDDAAGPGAARPAHNLPEAPTPFIGRETELAELTHLLEDPGNRLITILGPGGIGKTRLGLEAARGQSGAFADGVHFVPLAGTEDATLIASPIAAAIGISLSVRDRSAWNSDRFLAYLRGRQMLLLLDNFEHLLGGVGLIADILESAPAVRILATSREKLNVYGETVFSVDGMQLPQQATAADAAQSGAVQLFIQNAKRAQPNFTLTAENLADVIELCHIVEGNPLAIELAAAWSHMLTVAEIVAEIENSLDILTTDMYGIPERHRSIRSVFEVSWKRLSDVEQAALRQLSAFRGGFRREAAKAVAGASLRLLNALVDKSLVRVDAAGRYAMHELLRHYASERRKEIPSENTAARTRHSEYYGAFMSAMEARLTGQEQARGFAEIDLELENVLAGWNWAVMQKNLALIEQYIDSLCDYYRVHAWLDEGEDIFSRAAEALGWNGLEAVNEVAAAATPDHEYLIGKLLARYGRFNCQRPDNDWKAVRVREQSLAILAKHNADLERAYVLRYLGHAGNGPISARALYHQALDIFTQRGDLRGVGGALYRLGLLANQMGDYDLAYQHLQNCQQAFSQIGNPEGVANCLSELGYVAWAQGDYARAQHLLQESLAVYAELGYRGGIAWALRYAGFIQMTLDDAQTAEHLLQDSLVMEREMGNRGGTALALSDLGFVALERGDYRGAQQLGEESLALSKAIGFDANIVWPVTVLGAAAHGLGDLRAAERHFVSAFQSGTAALAIGHALHALAGLAQVRAAQDRHAETLELGVLILKHPGAWQWTKEQARLLVDELEACLPPETIVAARERVAHQSLQELAQALALEA